MESRDGLSGRVELIARVACGRLARSVRLIVLGASILAAPVSAQAPQPPAPQSVEDEAVGSRVLERQRAAYEAFQRGQERRYEAFQEERSAAYEAFMERIRAQYERFTGIVEEAQTHELDRVATRWAEPELSSQKVWIEYSDDLAERSRVDFETGTLTLERLGAPSDDDVRAGLRERVRAIVTKNRAQAFADDPISQEVERRGREEIEDLETARVEEKPILWPYLTGERELDPSRVDAVVGLLVARATIRDTVVAGERMQQVEIPLDTKTLMAQLERLESGEFAAPMPDLPPERLDRPPSWPPPEAPGERPPEAAPPPEALPRPPPRLASPSRRDRLPARARPFHDPVERFGEARGLDRALVFAIIETESAFNPLARSPVPAYGLMQIVPRSAGLDATQVLFGQPRILAPSYLYNADKNIEIGIVYLELLFERYLAGIEDSRSRLYCAIAAYNTGAGNVFRAFTGKTRPRAAFAAINARTPDEVYRHLIRKLPYRETRGYLANVVTRMAKYDR